MNQEEIIRVSWGGAVFELYRDPDLDWHCVGSRKTTELYRASGKEAPTLLDDAMHAAGFEKKTRQEVLHALMNALRERLFN